MKVMMFSVLDAAVSTYDRPFFARTKGEAIRSLMDAAREKSTNLNMHPSDFSLFLVGEFDQSLGILIPRDAPEKIVDVVALIENDVVF